jgi:flagellar hook-associated protein 2
MSSEPIRLGGLTSGFDTDSIIEQLLSVDQARIDTLKESKEINTAKVDTWNDMSEQLRLLAESVQKLKSDGTAGFTLFDDKLVSTSDSTVSTATAASSAVPAEYTVAVTSLARSHVAYGTQKATTYTLPAGGNVILNGVTIALTAGDALIDIATKINSASYLTGDELLASIVDERLTIQTKITGAASTIHGTVAGAPPFVNLTDDPSNILEGELGLIDVTGALVNVAQTSADSSFSVNGIPITRAENVVDDVISGVTLTMIKAGSATIDVNYNTAEIKETVVEFVDLYNETRDYIDRTRNATLSEDDQFGLFFSDSLMRELFNDMRSLTTQGVKMGGTDWDGTVLVNGAGTAGDKTLSLDGFTAGAGSLLQGDQFVINGDSTIYTLQNDATVAGNATTLDLKPPLVLAAADNATISLAIRSLEDFGVGVRTDTVSGTAGILGIIDEGKLDSLLATDVPFIKQIFTRSDSLEGSTGIARRLYDWIDHQTKISVSTAFKRSIEEIKIPGIEESNERIDDQIERLESRLLQKEAQLVKQFAEMESSMAKAQAAGNAVGSFSGGGGG